MEILIAIAVIALLIAIATRLRRTGDAWFERQCPHCRNKMAMTATACPWCNRESEPPRWVWQKRD